MFKQITILLGLSLLLTACPPVCNNPTEPVDLGAISQDILDKVPYVDGQEYFFKHNNGTVITYLANRSSKQEQTYCEHGCCDTYIYQINTTKLTTSYPVFSIELRLSNFDSNEHSIGINIGNSGFSLALDGIETFDDVMINGTVYSDVYKLKQADYFGDNTNAIYADSLYYQVAKGILKIKMSNDEYYEIDE